MTKEQLMQKWGDLSRPLKNDIDAVIEYEIAKSKDPQPALNPIAEAYERGEKIRNKIWLKDEWIKKYDETNGINENGRIIRTQEWTFWDNIIDWELYTEPTEQPAKQFDKDRFEAMFRAVVMGSGNPFTGDEFSLTEYIITKLDAYYATKEGGENE